MEIQLLTNAEFSTSEISNLLGISRYKINQYLIRFEMVKINNELMALQNKVETLEAQNQVLLNLLKKLS